MEHNFTLKVRNDILQRYFFEEKLCEIHQRYLNALS